MNSLEILKAVSVVNKDNGKHFTRSNRLDRITELLWNSDYRRINADGLFHLYSKKPISQLPDKLFVVSCHVDCAYGLTECFAQEAEGGILKGTFDNAITCAAVIETMLTSALPDNVVIAFTGDEENNSNGANELTKFLEKSKKKFRAVVLDVTDMGWEEKIGFTIENNFMSDKFGESVIETAEQSGSEWLFVPSDTDDIPKYVSKKRVVFEEAVSDESWEYDENDIECFSLCLPVKGNMHSNEGVIAYLKSYNEYTDVLKKLLIAVSAV